MPRNNRKGQPTGRIADATEAPSAGLRRAAAAPPLQGRGQVRIIGGQWRGRKLHFPQSAPVRPTPDRVRETLFNWLQFDLPGLRCLDLFAGSGALGLEALSRGAAETVFVERDPAASAALRENLRRLGCDRGQVVVADAFEFLRGVAPAAPYQLAFLDPPYGERWLLPALAALDSGHWLAPDAWAYLEDSAANGEPVLPGGWSLLRSKKAGDVGYHLARRHPRPGA
jgi:16S rRNA (guanine966-N2)-methyltransferase